MKAELLRTMPPNRSIQLPLWPYRRCPDNVVVLCISETKHYLEVLYKGEIFSIEKTSVIIHDTSGRHNSDSK